MPKYEFLMNGTYIETKSFDSDEDAIRYATDIAIKHDTQSMNVEWRKIYASEKKPNNSSSN